MGRINKYCLTNGTVNREQQNLYEGGSIPGKADFAYAVRETRDIMQRGRMGDYQAFDYACSYSGFFYDTLYCFGRTMFQNASGREISSSQLLICAWEDVLDGDVFLDEVIRFPYLSLDELLESASYKKKQIFDRDPIELDPNIVLNEKQLRNIAKAVYWLLMEKQVILQLPDGPNYEQLSLSVLHAIYSLLPKGDRREISFSTARYTSDIIRLRGRIRLILTNESTSKIGEAKWLRLNAEEAFTEEEEIIRRWQTETPENREDIELHFFALDHGKTAEMHRSLKGDLVKLEKLYHPASYWWEKNEEGRKFSSFEDVLAEYKENPALSIRYNRERFFQKTAELLDDHAGDENTPDLNLISTILDFLVAGKPGAKMRQEVVLRKINAFCDACSNEYHWFGEDQKWQDTLNNEISLLQEIFGITQTV